MSARQIIAALAVAWWAWGACVTAAPADASPQPFQLKEVLDGSFSASGLGAVWASGNQLARYTRGLIELIDVQTNATNVLVKESLLTSRNKNVASWTLSKDLRKLLWGYEVKAGFRHSTEAKYSVLNIQTEVWIDLHEGKHLQTVQMAPSGNGVAYVFENNVYYVEDILASADGIAITEDGSTDVYNGVPDWVYEEEVLSSGSALWLSPEGTYLAYAKFNDTLVEEFNYITYGQDQYTKVESLLYPKPGTTNPTVLLSVTRLADNFTETISVGNSALTEPILQNVAWTSDKQLIALWLNRVQNQILIESYTASENSESPWTRKTVLQDSLSDGWFDVSAPRAVAENLWAILLPRQLDGENQRFQRPTLFNNSVPTELVRSQLTASALYGWDSSNNNVFFQAAPAGQPGQRQVYSARVGDAAREAKCLSCSVMQPFNGGSACLYAAAAFSTDFSHVAITCSGPGPAVVGILKVNADGGVTWSHYWQQNEALLQRLSERVLPTVEANVTVQVAEGYTAQVRLWLPPGLDKGRKYPMLVYVYGGPGSQQVSEAFSVSWGYHLTTARNIIYASIDGRGSGYQGSRNLFALYRRLGTVEVQDQITVTQQLLQRYPFIDAERVGIWGWSYGGYATAMALARDSDGVFACGASVAPVTSWMLYDSIYTERYMGLPSENEAGYDNAIISNKVANFATHKFYLLHGNADDNVHYQQSMHLARALEEKDIFFEQQSYPDENHSIRSVVTHVYMSLGVFFDSCFQDTSKAAAATGPALLLVALLPLAAQLLN